MAASGPLTPRIIRTLFISALQQYFSGHAKYKWEKDRRKTKIFIQDEMAEDSRLQNIIPAIIVENSGYAFMDDAIGDNIQDLRPLPDKPYIHERYRQFIVQGGIAVHCYADASIAAEELAFETAFFISGLRLDVRDMLPNVQHISTPRQTKANTVAREGWAYTYDSTVSFDYATAYRVRHVPVDIGELLKDIPIEYSE